MKRAYQIRLTITKTADVWVLADRGKSAKESVERDYRRIKDCHCNSYVEELECLDSCSILEVPDSDPLYDENLEELGYDEFHRLKAKAIEEEGGEE
jgi:hypothetical protein